MPNAWHLPLLNLIKLTCCAVGYSKRDDLMIFEVNPDPSTPLKPNTPKYVLAKSHLAKRISEYMQ
ncbi:hypothetical protein VEJY3_18171 [Vibrio sp. EJY3]|nr:hypothetical protein VEJY3_18171 [Vibrio sp. EJY3]AXT72910.1 hypothetical protein DBX26_18285 [Vibrio sp. dhg]